MKKTSNKIEIKVCSLYSKGFSHNSISQALIISKPTIWRILKRNKITTIRTTGPHPDNKIKVNEDFFKNIDNEKSAYWLGFLYSDGCVSKQQSGSLCLSLGLEQKD